jgi:hypothetical protein
MTINEDYEFNQMREMMIHLYDIDISTTIYDFSPNIMIDC